MSIGPIQIFAIAFPDSSRLHGRIAEELDKLRDAGAIRIVDSLAVMNEGENSIMVRTSDLNEKQREELGAVMGALIGLGAAGAEGAAAGATLGAERAAATGKAGAGKKMAAQVLADLPEGSSVLLLVIEHMWAVPLRDAVRDAGGIVLAHRGVSVEDLIALGVAIGESA